MHPPRCDACFLIPYIIVIATSCLTLKMLSLLLGLLQDALPEHAAALPDAEAEVPPAEEAAPEPQQLPPVDQEQAEPNLRLKLPSAGAAQS